MKSRELKVNLEVVKDGGTQFFNVYINGKQTKAYITVQPYPDGSLNASVHKTETPGSTPAKETIWDIA